LIRNAPQPIGGCRECVLGLRAALPTIPFNSDQLRIELNDALSVPGLSLTILLPGWRDFPPSSAGLAHRRAAVYQP
jgi:hypothetical protein